MNENFELRDETPTGSPATFYGAFSPNGDRLCTIWGYPDRPAWIGDFAEIKEIPKDVGVSTTPENAVRAFLAWKIGADATPFLKRGAGNVKNPLVDGYVRSKLKSLE